MRREPRLAIVGIVSNVVCALDEAAGRFRHCPGRACPFWADSFCSIAGLRADLGGNRSLVKHLLALRGKLIAFDLRSCALLSRRTP